MKPFFTPYRSGSIPPLRIRLRLPRTEIVSNPPSFKRDGLKAIKQKHYCPNHFPFCRASIAEKKHFICLEGQRRWFILARPYVATDYFSVRLDGLSVFIPFLKWEKVVPCGRVVGFCVAPCPFLDYYRPSSSTGVPLRSKQLLAAHNTSLLLCSSGVGAISDFFQQQQPLVIKLVQWNLKLMTVHVSCFN